MPPDEEASTKHSQTSDTPHEVMDLQHDPLSVPSHRRSLIPPKQTIVKSLHAGGNQTHTEPNSSPTILTFLPVIFILALVGTILSIFIHQHLIPQLAICCNGGFSYWARRFVDLVLVSFFTIMFLISYFFAIIVSPGAIPDDSIWSIPSVDEQEPSTQTQESPVTETNKIGGRRICKWCRQYKPDRTHHCRVCRKCVLKMDHHCPWIFNCVGWRNHKYFMLSLIHGACASILIAASMLPTVIHAFTQRNMMFTTLFWLLFGTTLDVMLALSLLMFLTFHLWLIVKGMTTIEFCEKRSYYNSQKNSVWSNGYAANLKDAFGPNPFLWLIPIDNRSGNGINFFSENSRLLSELDIPDHEWISEE